MVSVNCPGCGNQVSFRSEFSTHAVCPSCDSLLVRQGAQVDRIGKVAELAPDGSPLQVGTNGSYNGTAFQLVGRMQLSYGDGFWNEWYLLYANGEAGWLGEAMGEFFINSLAKISGGLPEAGALAPGDGLSLGGDVFVATGSVTSTLVSFEGELPFVVESHDPFLTVDLRSATGKAATIDYSESPPLLFLGEYKAFPAFSFSNLRGLGPDPTQGANSTLEAQGVEKFNCPSCGASHTVSGGVRSKVLVCQYCGSAVDIADPKLEILWKEESMRADLQRGITLPIGSTTKLEGYDYTLIGFIKKSVTYEGINYPWVEYLLYNPLMGYRWLVEGDGHFMLMEPMDRLPTQKAGSMPVTRPTEEAISYEGLTYRHFQTSNPRVDAVAGEFYWRIRQFETATNFDYVCPPHMLSLESSETGFTWSKGRYLSHPQVQSLFGLGKPLRAATGVSPIEPNPYGDSAGSNWKVFWVAMLLGLFLLASGLLAGGGAEVWTTGPQVYDTYRNFPPKESSPFTVKGSGNLAFDFEGSLNERWLYFDTALVDTKTNQETKVGSTIEQYGGSGLARSSVRITGIPSGDYRLRWTVKSGTKTTTPDVADEKVKSDPVSYKITLRRGVAVWGWFVLMMVALLPLAVFESARRSSFETKRWYNSDHA